MNDRRYNVVSVDGEKKLKDTWNDKIVEGVLLSNSLSMKVNISDEVEFKDGCLVMISSSNISISGVTTFYKGSEVKIRENVHLHRVLFMNGTYDFLSNNQVVIEGAVMTGSIKFVGSTTYIKNCSLHCKSTFITGVNILENVTIAAGFAGKNVKVNHNSIENVMLVDSVFECNDYLKLERADITNCKIEVTRNINITDCMRIRKNFDGSRVETHGRTIIDDFEYEEPEEYHPF